ncbi:MAG TPA: hypothetical protein PK830_09105 [Candidatus Atribacteria bacterium]|nr:hypothetical protein [Candidatus Atribacteria bacterium]HPT79243.1 hypothetical protein [Candidatus Atribacteria bacterium]
MKKKILAVIAVLLVAAAIIAVYKFFIIPKATADEKTVNIHIVIEHQDIDKQFTYTTKFEYLGELIKEKKDELGADFGEFTGLGAYVKAMMDYTADESKEFFSIKINDVDAEYGIDQIPLKDGEIYSFVLTTWN